MGRRTTFTEDVGRKICEQLANGHSLLAISKTPGMPKISTLQGWTWNAEWSDETFVGNYTRARACGAHVQFDELKELEDQLLDKSDDIDPHSARIAIDSRKWRLSKMLPGTYGDRSHLEVSGGLNDLTPKDHAPDWVKERLLAIAAKKEGAVIEHDDQATEEPAEPDTDNSTQH